ncbi:vomeronasal type-1 receptor 4-like [Peromyscus maniculatus bairdii]|uniref:vomeronasal type-1 receptor 4-like n=1 Tax=Peromyscus maniculatus bairdii TaxID=230844 RepID=UPI00077DB807|nr:vomeronasal type-1 receptor 4-like [Peromyscus maniculatus bairdii]
MPSHRIDIWNLTIKIIFLSQTMAGILGNFSLLYYYGVHYGESKLKPTYLIHMHLMAANTLIILSTGVPNTITAFGMKNFLSNSVCRLILYIQRVGRSVSIATTCLLSVFQVITISHKECCCKDQRVKASKYIGHSIALLWVLYMLINVIFPVYPFIKRNSKNMTSKRDFGYCSTIGRDGINDTLYSALVVCPEIFFSLLMAWSSGSMIVILYRHKLKVQHIRSTSGSSKICFESKATQSILALVSTFLAFYTLSSILQGCVALLYNHSSWLVNINRLTSLGFPCFAPFVLINCYSVVPRLSLVWIRNKISNSYFKYVNDMFLSGIQLFTLPSPSQSQYRKLREY